MKASTLAAAALALGVASFGIAHAYPNPNFHPGGTTTTTEPSRSNVPSGVSAVPEPATWALMLVGVAGLGLSLRARRTRTV